MQLKIQWIAQSGKYWRSKLFDIKHSGRLRYCLWWTELGNVHMHIIAVLWKSDVTWLYKPFSELRQCHVNDEYASNVDKLGYRQQDDLLRKGLVQINLKFDHFLDYDISEACEFHGRIFQFWFSVHGKQKRIQFLGGELKGKLCYIYLENVSFVNL